LSLDAAALRALQSSLLARARQPAPADWLPVVMARVAVGVVNPDVASFLASHVSRFMLLDYRLVLDDDDLDVTARSALLFDAACRLRDAGLIWGWRNEQLDVRPVPDAEPIATIERSACRALGVTTRAVHLNAFTPNGDLMIARRAAHKQIDPGLWDNLVGGMVPAGESEGDALAREAHEEAGIDIARHTLVRGGHVRVARVVPEGFQSEIVQVFDAVLPPGTAPHNNDGEVAEFATRDCMEVLAAIERGEFTLESALVALDALLRRGDGTEARIP
jgi:isopentenyldiphosphate isomerase